MRRFFRKGLTLIELIIIIVVFSIAIPPLLIAVGTAVKKIAQAEYFISGTVAGRSLLEEIISKRFDENIVCFTPTVPANCWSTHLGFDSSTKGADGQTLENANDKDNWDDIDDFNGFVEQDPPFYKGFRREVRVYYIDPDNADLNTPHVDTQGEAVPTNYKRVDVVVSHPLTGDLHFSFIMSSEY